MSLELLIQILTSIGTVGATIFAGCAVIQARKNNQIALDEIKQNRRVEMNIFPKDFQNDFPVYNFISDFTVSGDKVQNTKNDDKSNFYLNMRNIGNLPARNVQVSFKYKGIEDFIESYSGEKAYKVEDRKRFRLTNNNGNSYIEFYPTDDGNTCNFELSSHQEQNGCLMPFDYPESSFNIKLPLFYIYLVNLKSMYEDINLFTLIINVSYDDPNNKERTEQNFYITPEFLNPERYKPKPTNRDEFKTKVLNDKFDWFKYSGRFIVLEK